MAETTHLLGLPLKHKPKDIKPQGSGSGLDADKVDGLHASELGGGGPHAASHETGGSDKVHFADLEHSSNDATLHDALTSTPHISQAEKDKIHDRLHTLDSSLDHSGTITDTQHGSRGSGLHADSHALDHRGKQLLQNGLDANKPAAGQVGRIYYATDTKIFYYDNGTSWEEYLRAETVTRLAQLSEKSHDSLTGITANQHHPKVHNLAHIDHPDVNISSPSDGQMLVYDSAASKWKNLDPNVTVLDITKVTTAKKIDLTVTGIVHTPATGKKIRIKAFEWSSNADIVTALRFGTAGDLLFAIQAKGVVGMNLVGCNIEGAVNEALYGYLSGTGTMKGTVLIEEV